MKRLDSNHHLNFTVHSFKLLTSLFIGLIGLSGCTSLYFQKQQAPTGSLSYQLENWPYDEYWNGIIFNGEKIGFHHFQLEQEENSSLIKLSSEASLQFQLLGYEKKVTLQSEDWVDQKLTLKRFKYRYNLDGNEQTISGSVNNNILNVKKSISGQIEINKHALLEPLYPSAALYLLPLLQGIEVGKEYNYQVYDGETQKISAVEQRIVSYESSDLFQGHAYNLETQWHGFEINTWINNQGLPQLELSLNGAMISDLESEARAKKYLTQAALSKKESLIDLSLIPSNLPTNKIRSLKKQRYIINGIPKDIKLTDSAGQQCKSFGQNWHCSINREQTYNALSDKPIIDPEPLKPFLVSNILIPSNSSQIQAITKQLSINKNSSTQQKITSIVNWINSNIQPAAVDNFSALDVLNNGKAECQGHAMLFAAIARALKIPSRVVNGVVYSEQHSGFLYHTWAESWTGNSWQAVDPVFKQTVADATHIKLIEGETLADLLPIANLIGKLKIQAIEENDTTLRDN